MEDMALLFIIILINGFVAEAILSFSKKTKYLSLAIIIIGGIICSFCGGQITDLPWSSPEAQGINSAKLKEMGNSIPTQHPQIRSVIVVRHGYTVFERYYQGNTPYSMNIVCSDTKSFTGALVGIALKKGYIKSINQKAID